MDTEDPLYFQHEYETKSSRIKSRASNNIAPGGGANVRRNSFQRRRAEGDGRQSLGSPPSYFGEDESPRFRTATAMSEQQKNNRTIPERVAQFYYSLGLFCSSHSYVIHSTFIYMY